ncbi:MAG: UDP-3-O-(3-hydroxymyristoyl)glucosamine N-acyltransferase [Rhodospirillales bacterium]|nr:UDP-3-O-(3-hydroxymyristoyl)glucosamine N-acyltransferase [Rhodospirillales bacterium]
MADFRFFQRAKPMTLAHLAALAGAEVVQGDPETVVADVAALDHAGPDDISFLDNIRYKEQFAVTKAAACIVAQEMCDLAPNGLALLVSPHPYKSYAKVAQAFYPQETSPEPYISPQAIIDPTAKIGAGCVIEAGAVIGPHVELGDCCRIGANATISYAVIGAYVRIYPGARIGQDGFGFAIDPAGHVKVPQLGRVVIGDHVEIGANSCIDRGAGPDTVIGQGTWIDNLVQIGHNVKIGKGCVIVAQVGISGSTVIDDYAVIAGQAGVAGHLHIGMGARIAAQAGIMRDVPAGAEVMGAPAIPIKQFMRQIATLNKLTKKSR